MTVSVVVATRDREDRLRRALEALRRQHGAGEFEVIIVDDASTDGTQAFLSTLEESDGPMRIRTIRRESAGGPGGARNTGWRQASGSVIAFTDDDCEPEPGWLAALTAPLSPGARHFAQGATMPNPDEAHDAGPFTRTLEVARLGPWFPTCNVAYPRQALEALNGFDEGLTRGEDTDLAWRAQALGYRPLWAGDAVVRHAVMDLGARGKIRLAWAWSPAVRVLANHPALRDELIGGVFWKRSHALLALAAIGVLLGGKWRPFALLVLPYMRHVRGALITEGTSLWLAPYVAVHDAVEFAAMIRGSASARTLVL